jgi:NAD kinase
MNKKSWLDYLYYKVGNQQYDFRVNGLKKKDEVVISTKWKKYSEVCFPIDIGEDWKIEYVNNREILPCEVVIDLEEEGSIEEIIKKLTEDNLTFYVFKTGSRGFHIHIWFKEVLTNDEKLRIVKRYGGDEQKANQGTTIALEYAPHWKTGKIKEPYPLENGN